MQTATIVGQKGTKNLPTTVTQIGSFVAAGAGASISSLLACNTSAGAIYVSIGYYDGTNTYWYALGCPIAPGDTLNVLGVSGSRIVLAPGQYIVGQANTPNACDVTMSVTSYT